MNPRLSARTAHVSKQSFGQLSYCVLTPRTDIGSRWENTQGREDRGN